MDPVFAGKVNGYMFPHKNVQIALRVVVTATKKPMKGMMEMNMNYKMGMIGEWVMLKSHSSVDNRSLIRIIVFLAYLLLVLHIC